MPTRLALGDARGWRTLRWLGRIVLVLACWPAWYAFFGKPGFDTEAALVGFPGVVAGLALWLWSGHRTRNPSKSLEIDRAAGVARLRDGPVATAVSPLAELVGWTIRSYLVTTRTRHGTTQSTWYAVRCAGFGAQDLYVDDREADCKAFIHAAEAAAFPFDSTGWRFSEGVVGAVMKRHGLTDRDALLWAASRLDDGNRYLNEPELEAAARGLTETTLAARAGGAVDALLGRLTGQPARLLLAAASLGALVGAGAIARDPAAEPGLAIVLALGVLPLALAWRAVALTAAGILLAALAGAALIAKPWVAPITHTWMGVTEAFSPSSETHLYFVLPGIGLAVVALVLVAGLRTRRHP